MDTTQCEGYGRYFLMVLEPLDGLSTCAVLQGWSHSYIHADFVSRPFCLLNNHNSSSATDALSKYSSPGRYWTYCRIVWAISLRGLQTGSTAMHAQCTGLCGLTIDIPACVML